MTMKRLSDRLYDCLVGRFGWKRVFAASGVFNAFFGINAFYGAATEDEWALLYLGSGSISFYCVYIMARCYVRQEQEEKEDARK